MDAATLAFLSICNQIDVKTATTAASSTNLGSSWSVINSWGQGAAPTLTGRVCDNTTLGALPFPSTTPILGSAGWRLSKYRFIIQNGGIGGVALDRLVDYGGASAILTTAQSFSAQSLTRYTSGVGNQIFLEVYATSTSSVATTATISYTNQAGTSGRTSVISLATGWCTTQRIYSVPLQSGDTGVRSIESVTLGTTSPNAGNFGCIIARTIGSFTSGMPNLTGGCGDSSFRDISGFCWKPILTNACLFLTYICTTTAIGTCDFSYSLI